MPGKEQENNGATLDLSCLYEYADGDKDSVRDILDLFYQSFDQGLDDLRNNITDGENLAWSEAAHKLKGVSGYVGAHELKRICSFAQDLKIANSKQRSELVLLIRNRYERVCTELRYIFRSE